MTSSGFLALAGCLDVNAVDAHFLTTDRLAKSDCDIP
jgi:hypothetical protein